MVPFSRTTGEQYMQPTKKAGEDGDLEVYHISFLDVYKLCCLYYSDT